MSFEEEKPVYVIGTLHVKDQEEYIARYGMPVAKLLDAVGAEVLSVTPAPEVLEGTWNFSWLVLLRFPSKAVATQWYTSDAYLPFRSLRQNELTAGGTLILSDAFDLSNFVPAA